MFAELGPCTSMQDHTQLFVAIFTSINTALGIFLAHRRYRQDRFYRTETRREFERWRKSSKISNRNIYGQHDTDEPQP